MSDVTAQETAKGSGEDPVMQADVVPDKETAKESGEDPAMQADVVPDNETAKESAEDPVVQAGVVAGQETGKEEPLGQASAVAGQETSGEGPGSVDTELPAESAESKTEAIGDKAVHSPSIDSPAEESGAANGQKAMKGRGRRLKRQFEDGLEKERQLEASGKAAEVSKGEEPAVKSAEKKKKPQSAKKNSVGGGRKSAAKKETTTEEGKNDTTADDGNKMEEETSKKEIPKAETRTRPKHSRQSKSPSAKAEEGEDVEMEDQKTEKSEEKEKDASASARKKRGRASMNGKKESDGAEPQKSEEEEKEKEEDDDSKKKRRKSTVVTSKSGTEQGSRRSSRGGAKSAEKEAEDDNGAGIGQNSSNKEKTVAASADPFKFDDTNGSSLPSPTAIKRTYGHHQKTKSAEKNTTSTPPKSAEKAPLSAGKGRKQKVGESSPKPGSASRSTRTTKGSSSKKGTIQEAEKEEKSPVRNRRQSAKKKAEKETEEEEEEEEEVVAETDKTTSLSGRRQSAKKKAEKEKEEAEEVTTTRRRGSARKEKKGKDEEGEVKEEGGEEKEEEGEEKEEEEEEEEVVAEATSSRRKSSRSEEKENEEEGETASGRRRRSARKSVGGEQESSSSSSPLQQKRKGSGSAVKEKDATGQEETGGKKSPPQQRSRKSSGMEVDKIVEELRSEKTSNQARLNALQKAATLAEKGKGKALLDSGIASVVFSLLKPSVSALTIGTAAYAINVLAKEDLDVMADEALKGDNLSSLVKFLNDKERGRKGVVENSACALVQLCLDSRIREKVRETEGSFATFNQLLQLKQPHIVEAIANLVDVLSEDAASQVAMKDNGILKSFALLLENSDYTKAIEDTLSALHNLARSESQENRGALREAGIISPLVGLLGKKLSKKSSANVVDRALLLLAELAEDEVNREEIGRKGGVEKVLSLLKRTDLEEDTRSSAASALFNLVIDNENNQLEVLNNEGIKTVVKLLKSESVQESAFGIIFNLAGHDSCRDAIREAEALPILLESLENPFQDIQDYALKAVSNMVVSSEVNSNEVVRLGGVPGVVRLLSSNHDDLLIACCNCIMNMCEHEQAQQAFGSAGAIDALLPLLSAPKPEIVSVAASTLADLALNTDNQERIGADAMKRLVDLLLPTEDISVRTQAARSIANLTDRNEQNQVRAHEAKIELRLVELLSHSQEEVVLYALQAISSLVEHAQVKEELLSQNLRSSLETVLKGASEANRKEAQSIIDRLDGKGKGAPEGDS